MASRKRRTEREKVREAAEALLQLGSADLSAAAERPEYQQFPRGFHLTCRRFAKREHWTLHESACLLCGFDPKRPRNVLPGHEAWDHVIQEFEERLERSSLWVREKVEHEFLQSSKVMEWALSNLLIVPRVLLWAMGYDVTRKGDDWIETADVKRPKDRTPQTMKRQAQEIAAKLWAENRKMTIEEVIAHKNLKPISDHYQPGTLRKWVREVDPRPAHERVGRSRKPDTS